MDRDDEQFLRQAIALAREGMDRGDGGPFGCVIVKDGQVVGTGNNRVTSTNDPTAHAEVVAIRAACARLGSFQLDGCTVYTSCEPCPMCLGALYWARPARIVYAATRADAADAGFDDSLIYEELPLPPDQRRYAMEQGAREEALAVFAAWKAQPGLVRY
ncbi:MAG: nucleoside deaminase [Flavobacteriales bacterium]|nr:nucleoside deaminase [Flavobacteriales bacterium]